jgi:uncharacterized protein YbaP (TraB family)
MRRLAAIALLALAMPLAAAEPFAKGLLWRVSNAAAPPSHVFGTIHLADPRALDIPPRVLRALDESRSFAMEVPQWAGHDWRLFEAAQFDDGRDLASLVGEDTYRRVRAALGERAIPDAVIARIKPWAALANLAVYPEGYEGVTLDQKLFALARGRGLKIAALEGTEEHIAVFEGIPLETQIAMLKHTLENRDWLASQIEPTLQAWLKRDLSGIRAVNERVAARFPEMAEHYRRLDRHLVGNRTIVMAHRLFLPLRSGRVFVAVGAAHLSGEEGLLRLIEKQGYRVQRVY